MTNSRFADPLGINSAPEAEPSGFDGRGVCPTIKNPFEGVNRDASGFLTVTKGCTVLIGSHNHKVLRVSRGVAYVAGLFGHGTVMALCRHLYVVV